MICTEFVVIVSSDFVFNFVSKFANPFFVYMSFKTQFTTVYCNLWIIFMFILDVFIVAVVCKLYKASYRPKSILQKRRAKLHQNIINFA